MFDAALGKPQYRDWLLPLVPDGQRGLESLKYLSGTPLLLPDGTRPDLFSMELNTAWAMGSDPVRLLVRLHAQCEVHCYVEGSNRAWLAAIIREGRAANIMREAAGWEDVIKLLECRDDEPVICSYSVCESFPNFESLPATHPLKRRRDKKRFDEFYELEDAWDVCVDGLRAPADGLEMMPDNWGDFFFLHGLSALDLRSLAKKAAEAKAF